MHRTIIILSIAAAGCVQSPEATTGGDLEALGEYEVDHNTCGPHWDGVYALSANRIAQYGAGSDQLFLEPADPSSPAERGRGRLTKGHMLGATLSLQIRFHVDGESILYDCSGEYSRSALLMSCDSGDSACHLSLRSVGNS